MRNSESPVARLFRAIAEPGEAAVKKLAKVLDVKPASVPAKLRPLVSEGLVCYSKDRRSVSVNPDFGHVLGIDLGASHLHFALADLTGEILEDTTVRIRPEDGPHKMIGQMKVTARELAKKGAKGKLLSVAVGVPSAVDPVTKAVTYANNLPGWRDVQLAHELEREFRVPVFMDNDCNMAAVGEHWKGVARGVDNFVFIGLGTGIGSGVFIGGKIYGGHNGAAGEMFKMNIDWRTWNDDFPETGQFESFVSGMGIAAEGHKALDDPSKPGAAGLAQERDAYFVFDAYRKGNPAAREVLEKIFIMLGVGMADVVGILDPDLFVLGGGIAKGAPEFMQEIVEKVMRRIQPTPPPVKLSSLDDKAQTFGAICSALEVAREAIVRRL